MSFIDVAIGSRVSFKLNQIVCPDLNQVIGQVSPDLAISGEIVFLSDCEKGNRRFAIVDVGGIMSPLIVPISLLKES